MTPANEEKEDDEEGITPSEERTNNEGTVCINIQL